MKPTDELVVPDAAAWRAWLAAHHDSADEVWLVLTRKGGAVTTLTRPEALDEALSFGWIDGQAASRDEQSTLQRYTPRRARSPWSKRNVEHIARLIAEGRMTPAGQAAVDAAKADGRWDAAYAAPSEEELPDDWAAALAGSARAAAMWDILTKTNRYSITHRLGQAKRADTRARRVAQFVEMLERGETIHPQKARLP